MPSRSESFSHRRTRWLWHTCATPRSSTHAGAASPVRRRTAARAGRGAARRSLSPARRRWCVHRSRLGELAAELAASLIVFGSDYRTPPSHAEPGTSAQRLIDGGTVAIAVAAAGQRTNRTTRSGRSRSRSRARQRRRAGDRQLARRPTRRDVVDASLEGIDLIVVGLSAGGTRDTLSSPATSAPSSTAPAVRCSRCRRALRSCSEAPR